MMMYSRQEARDLGHPEGFICEFHESNPDQTAVMYTCEECIYIEEDY